MVTQRYVIGFSNLDEQNPFTVKVREYLQEEAAKRGNIDLIVRDNDLNTKKAMANAREFASIPVDLAIVFHIDERANLEVIMPLKFKKIPVIAIDIPIPTAIYFGINNDEVGAMAGEAIGQWVKTNWQGQIDKVVVLTEQRVLDVFQRRFNSALDALKHVVDYNFDQVLRIDNGGTREITAERVSTVLNNWNDQHHIVVICMNDKIASGVLDAARSLNREDDIAVLSYDGTHVAIEEFQKPNSGLIVSPSFQPHLYGKGLIDLSLRILKGEDIPAWNYVQPLCLTRDNFKAYI